MSKAALRDRRSGRVAAGMVGDGWCFVCEGYVIIVTVVVSCRMLCVLLGCGWAGNEEGCGGCGFWRWMMGMRLVMLERGVRNTGRKDFIILIFQVNYHSRRAEFP